MNRQPLSLKVSAAYARDVGRGVVRIDSRSMDSLGIHAGDTVEIIGKKDGIDAKCYPLLPSDENLGVTRIDPDIRIRIGVSIEDTVTVRNLAPVPPENFVGEKLSLAGPEATQEAEKTEQARSEEDGKIITPPDDNSMASEPTGDQTTSRAPHIFILAGSCIDFEKERPKLMAFMNKLETAVHSKSDSKCYSDGNKALGWDFFLLEVAQNFAERLRNVYPDIDNQEAGTAEERFALWMNKQLAKSKLDFHLKLSDVPQEKVSGFRLDPEYYRDRTDLGDLK